MKQPTAVQRQYWESQLRRYKLDEDRGAPKWLSYGFSLTALDFDGRRVYRIQAVTAGERLADEREWPISLS